LVKYNGERIWARLPDGVELDDLISAGVFGLMDAIDAFDLRRVGCILFRDDVVEETGLGAGVLNNPVTSVVWLARRMAVYGMQIEPGDLILSGSFVRPVEAPSDSTFHADYGAFGTVDITFQ
jgi:2-oxo-hept-3-ene-1,7-dioate hydratase